MAAARRHWAVVMVVPLFVLAVIFALLRPGLDSRKAIAFVSFSPLDSTNNTSATTRPAYSPQAFQSYRHIQALRAELALSNYDMAALGLSTSSAHAIFGLVKAFDFSSPGALGIADANSQAARLALREAIHGINTGSADDATLSCLPALKQNVISAMNQRSDVFAPLVGQINAILDSNQQSMWFAARAAVALQREPGSVVSPGPFRYAGALTTDQIWRLDLVAREGGTLALGAEAPQILSATQWAHVQTAINNSGVYMQAVAGVDSIDLPSPGLQLNR